MYLPQASIDVEALLIKSRIGRILAGDQVLLLHKQNLHVINSLGIRLSLRQKITNNVHCHPITEHFLCDATARNPNLEHAEIFREIRIHLHVLVLLQRSLFRRRTSPRFFCACPVALLVFASFATTAVAVVAAAVSPPPTTAIRSFLSYALRTCFDRVTVGVVGDFSSATSPGC